MHASEAGNLGRLLGLADALAGGRDLLGQKGRGPADAHPSMYHLGIAQRSARVRRLPRLK